MTGPQALNAPLAGGGGDPAWTLAAGGQTASVTGAGGACCLPADSRQPAGQEPSGTQPPPGVRPGAAAIRAARLAPGAAGAWRARLHWPALLPLVPALLCAGVALALPATAQGAQLPLAGIASALVMLALLLSLHARFGGRRDAAFARRLAAAHAHDPDALVVTDSAGDPLAANLAAMTGQGNASPMALLSRDCADPRRMVDTLIDEALTNGHARRQFARAGGTLMVQVHALAGWAGTSRQQAGRQWARRARGVLVWRLSRLAQERPRPLDMLGLPVLSIGPDGTVLAANRAIRALCPALSAPAPVTHAPVTQGPVTKGPVTQGDDLLVLARQLARATAEGDNRPVPARLDARPYQAWPVPAEDGQVDVVFVPAPATEAPAAPAADDARAGAAVANKAGSSTLMAFSDFEEIPVALMMIGADGRIRRSNRLARALFCIEPGDAVFFSELVEGLGRPVSDWLADAHAGRSLNRPEVLRAIHPAQETFVQIILRRAPAPSNGLFAVISDATELKSLEARFAQSQKMQAIGQLAGGVAHDFNNLLTAISGHCDLLLMNRDYYDPEYDDLMQIHQNANRAAALVRQLLAFSRKQTMKPEMLPLESLLEDLAHLLTRLVGERITLSLVHDSRLGPIWADRRQLEQVILNLVVNARDAMPMGGEIRIETRALTLTAEEEHGRARLPPGDYAVIHVRDEGIGIPDDNLDKIFEPFFTTKKPGEGTGLGLSTAYGIVKQMGGYIFADSTEGIGTRFTLYFAAQPAPTGQGGECQGDGAAALVPIHPVPARQAAERARPHDPTMASTAPDEAGRQATVKGDTTLPMAADTARAGGLPPGVAPEYTAAEHTAPAGAMPVAATPGTGLPSAGGAPAAATSPVTGPVPATLARAPLPAGTEGVASAVLPTGSNVAPVSASARSVGRPQPDPDRSMATAPRSRGGGAARPASALTTSTTSALTTSAPTSSASPGSASSASLTSGTATPGTATPGTATPGTATPGTATAGSATREAGPARGAGVVVLLVEDEAPVRAFAARALRLQGYKVIEAESGEQALEFLQAEDLQVDVFVSDVIMPGLDGPGWVARALAARPRTPVVFMSGYAEDSLSAALSRTPGAVFLDKPFTLNGLCTLIEQQLARADRTSGRSPLRGGADG
ncbi:MAG: ATP-binding protein [Pararhodobacter sp.]